MTSRFQILALAAAAFFTVNTAARADERNPVGEQAAYQLDHSGSRTSSIIQDGSMTASVTGATADGYEVKLDYRMKLRLLGTKSGAKSLGIDAAFFSPEFLVQLRNQGTYVGAQFKAQWLNFEDVQTLDGRYYPQCDHILIYDIADKSPLAAVAAGLMGGDNIQNLKIKADIWYGVPVLGAVRLDVTGHYAGADMKMGVDYRAP